MNDKELKVGDRVHCGNVEGKILEIDADGMATLDEGGGARGYFPVSELQRIEQPGATTESQHEGGDAKCQADAESYAMNADAQMDTPANAIAEGREAGLDIPRSVRLLPCPFCGAPAKSSTLEAGGWYIGCSGPSCEIGPAVCCDTKEDSEAAWNRRQPQPRSDADNCDACGDPECVISESNRLDREPKATAILIIGDLAPAVLELLCEEWTILCGCKFDWGYCAGRAIVKAFQPDLSIVDPIINRHEKLIRALGGKAMRVSDDEAQISDAQKAVEQAAQNRRRLVSEYEDQFKQIRTLIARVLDCDLHFSAFEAVDCLIRRYDEQRQRADCAEAAHLEARRMWGEDNKAHGEAMAILTAEVERRVNADRHAANALDTLQEMTGSANHENPWLGVTAAVALLKHAGEGRDLLAAHLRDIHECTCGPLHSSKEGE